jgi:hypothetical protein
LEERILDPASANATSVAAVRQSRLKADLFFLHAPSVYDFRDREDLLFAHLSDSDSVNTTTIYEIYPLGLLSLKQRLRGGSNGGDR